MIIRPVQQGPGEFQSINGRSHSWEANLITDFSTTMTVRILWMQEMARLTAREHHFLYNYTFTGYWWTNCFGCKYSFSGWTQAARITFCRWGCPGKDPKPATLEKKDWGSSNFRLVWTTSARKPTLIFCVRERPGPWDSSWDYMSTEDC